MNRSIKTERLYSLGQYQNIKLSDEINDLPEEVMLNAELLARVRMLQFIHMELSFRRYIELTKELSHLSFDEAVGHLEELNVNTLDEIRQITAPQILEENIEE